MLWNCKNGCVKLENETMDYVSFGSGGKNLILLPGLSDGLATVKGCWRGRTACSLRNTRSGCSAAGTS